MANETEKKLLQKLKEDLETVKPDAFESGDVVDNLKEEFKQSNEPAKSEDSKPFSMKELSEEDLEKEVIDDDYEKSAEDYLESDSMTNEERSEINPKIEEKIATVQEKPAEQKIVQESPETEIKPKQEAITAPAPQDKPAQAPAPAYTPAPIITKKKSRLPLILLLIIFPLLIIGGIIAYYFFFM